MTQPGSRPSPRPSSRPTTVGEPVKQPVRPEHTNDQAKPESGQQQPAQLPPYGAGIAGQGGQQPEQTAGGQPGCVPPKDVFQLAMWAVTPAYSEEEAADRRAEVREILQQLIDGVTSDRQDNQNPAPYPMG